MKRLRSIALLVHIVLFVSSTLLFSIQAGFLQERKSADLPNHGHLFTKHSSTDNQSPEQLGENNETENEGSEIEKSSPGGLFLIFDQVTLTSIQASTWPQWRTAKVRLQPIYLDVRSLRI